MITINELDNESILMELEGELTIYVAEKFSQDMTKYLDKYQNINVDLSNVSEIDTSCYQVLLRAKLLSNKNNNKLELLNINENILPFFELYNLNDVLGVVEKV